MTNSPACWPQSEAPQRSSSWGCT